MGTPSRAISAEEGARRAWDRFPGCLPGRHPDLWLIKRSFLLDACVCARQPEAAPRRYVVIPVPAIGPRERRGRAGKTPEQLTHPPGRPPCPATPGCERVRGFRGEVVVSCALWGRLVCNTGKMKRARLSTGFLPAGPSAGEAYRTGAGRVCHVNTDQPAPASALTVPPG